MKGMWFLASMSFWTGLWFSADQWGQHLYKKEAYEEAAGSFADPMYRGIAWYRAGNFEQAARAFRSVPSPEGYFNLGNALVMQGSYEEAISAYDQALAQRPEWVEAQENRELARVRAERLETEGGRGTEGMLAADEVVFDDSPRGSEAGEDEVVAGEELSDAEQQALWMRKVQTRPADFLKAKFALQQQMESRGED